MHYPIRGELFLLWFCVALGESACMRGYLLGKRLTGPARLTLKEGDDDM